MPSYNIDLRDPQTLLRIIATLVEQNNGVMVFSAEDYDGIEKGKVLTIDYDRKKGQLSLRCTADFGSAVAVAPEAHAWTKPAEAAPLERHRVAAARDAERRAVPTDEDMADLEEAARRRQELARAVEEGKTPLKIRTVPPS
jgi:hypothetical protein